MNVTTAFSTSNSYLIGRMVVLDIFSIRDCLNIHFKVYFKDENAVIPEVGAFEMGLSTAKLSFRQGLQQLEAMDDFYIQRFYLNKEK